MTNEELNSPDWADKILALPENRQAEAIKDKIFTTQSLQDSSFLFTIIKSVRLCQKLLSNPEMSDEALKLVDKERLLRAMAQRID